MVLGKNSEKVQVVLSKKEAKRIKELAETEDRSISNWCAVIIREKLKSKK